MFPVSRGCASGSSQFRQYPILMFSSFAQVKSHIFIVPLYCFSFPYPNLLILSVTFTVPSPPFQRRTTMCHPLPVPRALNPHIRRASVVILVYNICFPCMYSQSCWTSRMVTVTSQRAPDAYVKQQRPPDNPRVAPTPTFMLAL